MTRPDRSSPTPAILVVDDEADIHTLAHDALGDGYRVVAATTYDAAFSLLRGFRFALVLADTADSAATEQERWAALEGLRAAAGDTPVIVFSAHGPAAFEGHAARGFADILPKPFDLDALLAMVAAHAGPAAHN